ncbi:MAG: UbiA family prenyltransferase [Euryarchaeota archaeon]|nr:UbiA family prenyltransferase [Euryarchaeota archaeon]
MFKTFKDFLTISRVNIQLGTAPHALLGIFLASSTIYNVFVIPVFAYLILYFILITFACDLNCLYDLEVDKLYKNNFYLACLSLGKHNIQLFCVLELCFAAFFIGYLVLQQFVITAILALIGIFFAIIYSMPPIRIKAKGVLSPFPVIIGLYMLPVLGGWFLLTSSVPIFFIMFVIGYAFMNEGFTLVNTCEDYTEDQQMGIKTWAHLLGVKKTLSVALVFSMLGYLCIVALLIKYYTIIKSFSLHNMIFIFFLILSSILIAKTSRDVWNVYRDKDVLLASKRYAKKMPQWFIITRYPLLLCSLFLLLGL